MHKQLEGCKALCQHGLLKVFCERLFRDLLVGFFFFQLIFYVLQLQIQNTVLI